MYEVEVKLRVADPVAVRGQIAALGAKPLDEVPVVEVDTFFVHPMRDFSRSDEALRMRRRGGSLELTYKGPRAVTEQGGKSREEWNVPLGADATPLLAALGFAASVRLEKRRQRFRLDGLTLALDEVAGVGWFLEVEAIAEDADRREAASDAVEAMVARLGLAAAPRTTDSYLEMAVAVGAAAVQSTQA